MTRAAGYRGTVTRLPRTAALAAAAVFAGILALGATACAPEPEPTATATTGPTETATATPTTSATTTPTPTETASADACLVGTWVMDQDALTAFYDQVNDLQAGSGVSFSPTGSATMVLGADGGYTWTPDAQVTAQASGVTIDLTFAGHMDGTYTATDTQITSDVVTTDDLQITATIDGTSTDPGDIAHEIAAAPLSDAAYTCSADTLTLESSMLDSSVTSNFRRG
ncbi:MAG: hypothetical protein ABS62_04395 [Microbacterium sp. SCN 70-200]|nr:MAG: hypothetical protein ABS62_04395 [Microbacterium sp. SCN 70-200]OJV79586.1 MAG: hypothetical protein BGO46_04045 [Microbacterium sp. 70-16]